MNSSLILVTGPGCAGCVRIKDRLEALGFYDKIILIDISNDRGKEFATRYNVKTIPLLIKEDAPGVIRDVLSGGNHTDAAIKGFINAGGS